MDVSARTVGLESVKSVPELPGSASLPVGSDTQLRIVVQSVRGVIEDGTKVNFTVPSGELRTADSFNITLGQSTRLILDINFARWTVEAGNVWIFTPVLGSVHARWVEPVRPLVRPGPRAD